MNKEPKYEFSFTASSLRLNEMIIVAKAKLENKVIDHVNELGGGKSATGRRMLAELKKRISKMSTEELKLFVNSDLVTQKQIAFLTVCRTYLFLRDFVLEVVREKFLVFDFQITEGDYISFYRRKQELHSEMDKLTTSTQQKIRQVTFKILEQAGLIDDTKHKVILPQLIDIKLIDILVRENPNWLKVLLTNPMANIKR